MIGALLIAFPIAAALAAVIGAFRSKRFNDWLGA